MQKKRSGQTDPRPPRGGSSSWTVPEPCAAGSWLLFSRRTSLLGQMHTNAFRSSKDKAWKQLSHSKNVSKKAAEGAGSGVRARGRVAAAAAGVAVGACLHTTHVLQAWRGFTSALLFSPKLARKRPSQRRPIARLADPPLA